MTITIDILKLEEEGKLPHWLSPKIRLSGKIEEIRKKHRDAWLKQKEEKREAQARRQRALEALSRLRAYSPDQPRVPQGEPGGGQWTDGGGGGNTSESASELYNNSTNHKLTYDELLNNLPKEQINAISDIEEKISKEIPTDAPVDKGGYLNPNGTYTREREIIHQRILNDIFTQNRINGARPAPGQSPTMTILGGRGGSGKSWFINSGVVDTNKALYLNPDDIMNKLPGYEGWNAPLMHGEASHIFKLADNMARNAGLNVIHDATMRSLQKNKEFIDEYKKAGYKINAYYMFIPPEEAAKRVANRLLEEGRFVPPDYTFYSRTNEATFDNLKKDVDYWEIYDNLVPRGTPPKLINKKQIASASRLAYSPDQPRVPEGEPGGGQWTDDGGGSNTGGSGGSSSNTTNRDNWPEHLKKLRIPPAWTDVKINTDPNADLLVTGKDSKGRPQYIYSDKYIASQSAAKFARVKQMEEYLPNFLKRNDENLNSSDSLLKDHAMVLGLIMETGIRPGSEKDTKADKNAYGATTLEGRHVVSTEKSTYLRFTGKKGVSLRIPIEDPLLARNLRQRASEVGSREQLFPKVSDNSLRKYTSEITNNMATPKDFRTLIGTSLADEIVHSMAVPQDDKSYKKSVMKVATAVAKKLGNTPAVALKAYISPFVFAEWKIQDA